MRQTNQKKWLHAGMIMATVVILLIGLVLFHGSKMQVMDKKAKSSVATKINAPKRQQGKYSREISETQNFVDGELSGSTGIYTNLKDTEQNQNSASGHEVLSESYGLLLNIYALEKDNKSFDKTWSQLQNTLNMEMGWSYRYSPKWDKKYPTNAAIDDLRIIYSLKLAASQFSDSGYIQRANKYSARFNRYMIKNGRMYDFYDSLSDKNNEYVTLCYIELKWLKQLTMEKSEKKELLRNMATILRNGYISDHLPFYKKNYHYATKQYDSLTTINTTESMLSILSLTELGLEKDRSIDFIKKKVDQRQLANAYHQDGSVADENQSAANYAIAAMIASEMNDKTFFEKSIHQMNTFRVNDKKSKFYGGFGYPETKAFYSFNNLMALLAYNY
ncbi:hypothetical protein M3N64_00745 [Sporolactobacillus sp. CPB3-1]|uniref:Glycosyl hydrolase n=1 Tax=Sporolactobacillus mangiferae TaxID=2940498 RepID=A0ABT0M6J6_9BACL|nr:hypothetical protein [Sporolactobacillus mangiferae]MCL1630481.1 hypothetical protein [Sporolactobacillus mangiferae]